MLTVDLVNARRRGNELQVVSLDRARRARAEELAGLYLGLARAHVGLEQDALEEAWDRLTLPARDRRLGDGLRKLVLDRCTFEPDAPCDPEELRRVLFSRATEVRRSLGEGEAFDRSGVVAEIGGPRGLDPATLERALYADLPGAHLLRSLDDVSAPGLVAAYELAQLQAVLLRAVEVRAVIRAKSPETYRFVFRKLKFLQLLFRIASDPEGGYRLTLDGPYSLFDSVTRYGLKLALALPALMSCDHFVLEADVRWGKERTPLAFRLAGKGAAPPGREEALLPEPAAALLDRLRALEGNPFEANIGSAILELPGVGLCVPDLELVHTQSGARVAVELLGFWSRDAVWRRIELARGGLQHPIVFLVSKHLRVSEAALEGDVPAALYVYAHTPNARTVVERALAVLERGAAVTPGS